VLTLPLPAAAPLLLCAWQDNTKMSMLRNATWTLSNFCRGKPQPDFQQVGRTASAWLLVGGWVGGRAGQQSRPAVPHLSKLCFGSVDAQQIKRAMPSFSCQVITSFSSCRWRPALQVKSALPALARLIHSQVRMLAAQAQSTFSSW